MALAPKGDPRRPLELAIRSTRVLAMVFLLFGSCAFLPLLMFSRNPLRSGAFLQASVLLIYIAPGAAYLVITIYLKRRRFWAVVAAMVLASIQLLLTLIAAFAFLMFMLRRQNGFEIIPAVLLCLIILALGQLIYHLALSFESIKYSPVEQQHGFEPLMIQPINPEPTAEQDKGI